MADHMNRKYWWRQCAEHLSFGNHFNAATSTSVLQSRVGITAICFAVAFPAISQPFAGLQQHFHDLFDKQLPSRAKPTTQAGATHKSVASNDPRRTIGGGRASTHVMSQGWPHQPSMGDAGDFSDLHLDLHFRWEIQLLDVAGDFVR